MYSITCPNSCHDVKSLEVGEMIQNAKKINILVPYESFWTYRYMYRHRDFKESIGERTVRQTDQQKLWPYLAAFRCQTTKQSYKIIR